MNRLLIYTVHKAGSSFLHQLTSEIAKRMELPYYSINDPQFFDDIKRKSWRAFILEGGKHGVFGPIRAGAAEPCAVGDRAGDSVILHVRDPRDVLTSLYYSYCYSHIRQSGVFSPSGDDRRRTAQKGIDRFVMDNAEDFKTRYELLGRICSMSNRSFLKYEDMVRDYGYWLGKFLPPFWALYQNGTRKPLPYDHYYEAFFQMHRDDFSPKEEDIFDHKRQIMPGDHRRKLKPETVQFLSGLFRDSLRTFGYSVSAAE